MRNDSEINCRSQPGETMTNSCFHFAREGKTIGILKVLFLILIWVLAASYFWIFGLAGGRFVLSFVIGVPLVITILVFKDK